MKYIIRKNKDEIKVFLLGKCGGKSSKWVIKGERLFYKGYWILFSKFNNKLCTIWTASLDNSELNGWIRWLLNEQNYHPDINILPIGLRKRSYYIDGYLKFDGKEIPWNPPGWLIINHDNHTI